MGKIKGWKKVKDTKKMELWHHITNMKTNNNTNTNKLVSVYPSKTYGGGIEYVFFARLSEPEYVDDDVYGKNVFSKDFPTLDLAREKAIKFMRSHP